MDRSIKTVQKLELVFEQYRKMYKHMKGEKEEAPRKRKVKKRKGKLRLSFGGTVNYSPIFALYQGFGT
jgi:hypothetical protein